VSDLFLRQIECKQAAPVRWSGEKHEVRGTHSEQQGEPKYAVCRNSRHSSGSL